MPLLGAIVLLIQFCFAYHALKTGRPYWWIFVIMGFPIMGCVIYYFVEVFPKTRESAKAERAINKVVSELSRAIDPEKELRQRIAEAELNPSIDNKIALARECVASNLPGEAVKLYRSCLAGAFVRDPPPQGARPRRCCARTRASRTGTCACSSRAHSRGRAT